MTPGFSIYVWQAVAVLLLLLPVVVASGYAIVWRSVLLRPWSFLAVGSACLFGLYVAIGELLFVPAFDAVVFVPSPARAATRPLWPFFRELAPTPIALLLISYPVMRWLRSLFKQQGSA